LPVMKSLTMSTTSSAFIRSLPAEGALGHSCSTERGCEHKPGDRAEGRPRLPSTITDTTTVRWPTSGGQRAIAAPLPQCAELLGAGEYMATWQLAGSQGPRSPYADEMTTSRPRAGGRRR
jgi:hypothetical protein